MTVHRIPPSRSSRRDFTYRVVYVLVIFVLLGCLYLGGHQPFSLSDSQTKIIGRLAIGIVAVATLTAALLSAGMGSLRHKRQLEFEIFGGKLVQRSAGEAPVEIPLAEIKSIREQGGCLLVESRDRRHHILVPKGVSQFEELEKELSIYSVVQKRSPGRLSGAILLPVLVAAWIFLSLSSKTAVAVPVGVATLVVYAWGISRQRSIVREKRAKWLVLVTYAASWAILAWLVLHQIRKL